MEPTRISLRGYGATSGYSDPIIHFERFQKGGCVVMIPEKVKEILKHEGVVASATQGKDGPHLINTWHSYVQITNPNHRLRVQLSPNN